MGLQHVARPSTPYPADMHDVAVVGGSLAGAMTAFHLARAGRSVVLLERCGDPPRRKACGEGLFPAGVLELHAAGLEDALTSASVELAGVRFHAGRHTATARLGFGGVGARGIRRDLLDPLVLDLARSSGVEIRTGIVVTGLRVAQSLAIAVTTSEGDVPARAIVGADGLNSRVRRLAGLDDGRHSGRYGASMHICLAEPALPWVDVRFHDDHEIYLTPVGAHELNVAVLARKPFMSRLAGDLTGRLAALIEADRALPFPWEPQSPAAAAGPFGRRARRPWRGNVVLVGDAAGFFDGITGEGMAVALVAARHCATAVDCFLAGAGCEPLRAYGGQLRRISRNSELLGRVSLLLGSRPALASWAVRNLARQPDTFDKLTAINAGGRGLSSLRPRDALALAVGM